jgi:DNA ligase-1
MSNCLPSSDKKYTNRPSPPYPAATCPLGDIKKGNSGKMYIVTADKRGTHRWVEYKGAESKTQKPSPWRCAKHPSKVLLAKVPQQQQQQQQQKQQQNKCVVSTEAKYRSRKSPPIPANECPDQTIRPGNDGKMYINKKAANGTHRWVLYKAPVPAKVTKQAVQAKQVSKKPTPVKQVQKQKPVQTSTCVQSTEAKYRSRKSPPIPANECPDDTIRTGNDGKLYVNKKGSNGVRRWVLYKGVAPAPAVVKTHAPPRPQAPAVILPTAVIQDVVQKIQQQGTYDIQKGVMKYSQLRPRQVQENKQKMLGRYVNDYYASIKYDGWQGVWDGKGKLHTKGGKKTFGIPDSWAALLPRGQAIAGEVIILGKQAPTVASLTRKDSEHWPNARFMAFDMPALKKPFEERTTTLKKLVQEQCRAHKDCPMIYVEQVKITSVDTLYEMFQRVIQGGGEGLVLTKADSVYIPQKKSMTRVKLKGRNDDEGKIISYTLTGNKDLKSLVVEMKSGKKFNLGIGFTDKMRQNYKTMLPLGKMAKFSFRELTDSGVPKEARFIGLRQDIY